LLRWLPLETIGISTLVRAYLDIESLRLGDRLNIEQVIDPGYWEL
jgi:sensor histidine kinase YesM